MKTIVYSCLTGGYDLPPQILDPEPDVTYCLFTDLPKVPSPWRRMDMPPRPPGASMRAWSRVVKIIPHMYLPEHDVNVWMDASLIIHSPIGPLARYWAAQFPLSAPAHYKRDCVYEEVEACRRWGLEFPARCDTVLARLEAYKVPRHYGLLENTFIIRRNTPDVVEVNREWWNLYQSWSDRDQLSLMPVLWHEGVTHGVLPFHPHKNEYYEQAKHLKPREVCPMPVTAKAVRKPKVRTVLGKRSKPKVHTEPPAVTAWAKLREKGVLTPEEWKIVTYVQGEEYANLFTRHRPSWEKSGCSEIQVYTDAATYDLLRPAGLPVHVIEGHDKAAPTRSATFARKIDCIEYAAGLGMFSRLLWLDADCYVSRPLKELWGLMGTANIGVCRMFHRNPRNRPEVQAGVIALQIDDYLERFFETWRHFMKYTKDPLAEQIGLSRVCEMAFDGLMPFTCAALSERRWNSEDNDRRDAWLCTLAEYRPSILHFTTGWWKDPGYWRDAILAATGKPPIQ